MKIEKLLNRTISLYPQEFGLPLNNTDFLDISCEQKVIVNDRKRRFDLLFNSDDSQVYAETKISSSSFNKKQLDDYLNCNKKFFYILYGLEERYNTTIKKLTDKSVEYVLIPPCTFIKELNKINYFKYNIEPNLKIMGGIIEDKDDYFNLFGDYIISRPKSNTNSEINDLIKNLTKSFKFKNIKYGNNENYIEFEERKLHISFNLFQFVFNKNNIGDRLENYKSNYSMVSSEKGNIEFYSTDMEYIGKYFENNHELWIRLNLEKSYSINDLIKL